MKIILNLILLVFIVSFLNAQTSQFQGTWKWINGNQTFCVFIAERTTDDGITSIGLDYKLCEINNNTETVIYSSLVNGQNLYVGVISFGIIDTNKIQGRITDCTHPYTTDCFDGGITLEYLPASGGMNSQQKIHWKLLNNYRGMYGYTTNTPPTGFNLPIDIILTKVN